VDKGASGGEVEVRGRRSEVRDQRSVRRRRMRLRRKDRTEERQTRGKGDGESGRRGDKGDCPKDSFGGMME